MREINKLYFESRIRHHFELGLILLGLGLGKLRPRAKVSLSERNKLYLEPRIRHHLG